MLPAYGLPPLGMTCGKVQQKRQYERFAGDKTPFARDKTRSLATKPGAGFHLGIARNIRHFSYKPTLAAVASPGILSSRRVSGRGGKKTVDKPCAD
jgi:hypothetical protein